MKRSQINAAIQRMEETAKKHGFSLPSFCGWTPENWLGKGHAYDEIVKPCWLGRHRLWRGKFDELGFTLITLRNGKPNRPSIKKLMPEKLLMLEECQYSPMHFPLVQNGGHHQPRRRQYPDSGLQRGPDEKLADTPVRCFRMGGSTPCRPAHRFGSAPARALPLRLTSTMILG
jgi:hypothetical protein